MTVERRMTTVLAPTDAAGGLEILVDEVAALLEVVDAFDAVAPSELLPNDLGLLDLDPLLPHDVLPHLQHRHRVLVRMRRIEIVRRRLLELNIPLLPSHSSELILCSLFTRMVHGCRLGFTMKQQWCDGSVMVVAWLLIDEA